MEMFIQMGYIVIFSSTFPLAGLCALINNIIEIRSDAFKLVKIHQRPIAQRVTNIGAWQNAFNILIIFSIMMNCTLIATSGMVNRVFIGLTSIQCIILLICVEVSILRLYIFRYS